MTYQEKADVLKVDILKGAKAAFFEAMLDGYAGGENRKSIKTSGNDGYTTITYTTEDSKYRVVDRYCTTPLSDWSAGTTTIFYRVNLIWVPVWWMEYNGFYYKNVIPFLKSAIRQSYEMEIFNGGRGPARYNDSGIEYNNIWSGDFERFLGREEIEDKLNGELLGFHSFSGRSLL
ncbi:MAG: DUF5680 domain-containing protein [Candidatus Paceibacterota bacterium]|jgi:hypothetical protein